MDVFFLRFFLFFARFFSKLCAQSSFLKCGPPDDVATGRLGLLLIPMEVAVHIWRGICALVFERAAQICEEGA